MLFRSYYYPIQSNFVYEKIGNVNDKVVVTSSNTKIIPEISSIRLEQSQGSGYAVIKSGQNTGQSDISVSIEGIGSKSLPITVIDTKSHNTTKIFSPLGNDEIFLNGNGDADVVPGIQLFTFLNGRLGDLHQVRFNRQAATRRHGVAGVQGQVHDDLFKLGRIETDTPNVGLGIDDQTNVFAHQPFEHVLHLEQ